MAPQIFAGLFYLMSIAGVFQIATDGSTALIACSAMISPGRTNPDPPAQVRPLSGAALEQACRDYAARALSDSQQWMNSSCSSKLGVSPQLFSSDYNIHFNRCKSTLGTTINSDQDARNKYLTQCRSAGTITTTTTQPTQNTNQNTNQQAQSPLSGLWEIHSTDLRTLAEYHYTYRFIFNGNQFTGSYVDPASNPSEFKGIISSNGERIEYSKPTRNIAPTMPPGAWELTDTTGLSVTHAGISPPFRY